MLSPNYAFNPIAEQALRPNQTIVPQRVNAALGGLAPSTMESAKIQMKRHAAKQMTLPGIDLRPKYAAVAPGRLPTNTTANQHAVHRWFNFIAGFAPEFVALHCPESPGVLLDPFAGCGTSLVVAQAHGHRAIGFEPHPFFVRIARAKTSAPPTRSRLRHIEDVLLTGITAGCPARPLPDPARAFLAKLFDEPTLTQLLGARAALEDAGLHEDDLAFLLLSRVVDMCSKAQTDGIYKAPTSYKRAAAPLDAVRDVICEVWGDAQLVQESGTLPSAVIHQCSSEDMGLVGSGSVDVAVTSPPYLNNFDFAEMTRMHLYFWGICGSWREITEAVRSQLIVNTTTALNGHRDIQAEYRAAIPRSVLPELDQIVRALAIERQRRPGKKEYDLLVYPYFSQILRVLQETLRCLKPGSGTHVVVADAAFYGIHVSTPQLLASMMAEMGYSSVACTKLRDRGHRWILDKRDGSPTGLGEYHVSAARGLTS